MIGNAVSRYNPRKGAGVVGLKCTNHSHDNRLSPDKQILGIKPRAAVRPTPSYVLVRPIDVVQLFLEFFLDFLGAVLTENILK